MPKTNNIHVFVSSSYTEIEQNRILLDKRVFQFLENLCLRQYTKYEAIELSRGVRKDMDNYRKIIQNYLNELARSRRNSFLNHLGNKYRRKLNKTKPVAKKFFHCNKNHFFKPFRQ
jgi:hypothetical protein